MAISVVSTLPPCSNCGEPLTAAQRLCPKCGVENPGYFAEAVKDVSVSSIEQERTAAPPASVAANDSVAGLPVAVREANFRCMLAELENAAASQRKVIANIGLSGAGKSWLITRMGHTRQARYSASLYRATGERELITPMSGSHLPRTATTDTYVWDLATGQKNSTSRSGGWRVIDIAGELISDRQFIRHIAQAKPLYDLFLMTLAQVDALVVVIDGRKIGNDLTSNVHAAGSLQHRILKLDGEYTDILNELARLMHFLRHWQLTNHKTPNTPAVLAELKAAIQVDPQLRLAGEQSKIETPMLLVVSKADQIIRLQQSVTAPFPAPGPDVLRFAQAYFPKTLDRACGQFATTRWAFAAPFVGQPDRGSQPASQGAPQIDPSEIVDLDLPSFGVRDVLHWLDTELACAGKRPALTAADALHRVRRWLPWRGRRS